MPTRLNREPESEFHAVISCEHARNLRSELKNHWPLPDEKTPIMGQTGWSLFLSHISQNVRELIALMLRRTWLVRK